MQAVTPSLLELQRAVLASLAGGDDAAAAAQVLVDGIDAPARLAIYRHTRESTLVNALRLAYPAVRQLVGGEFFEGAARAFLAAHPVRSALLDDYGASLAAFLAGFEPARSLAYLPDVAALEWAVNRALHAPDAPALDPRRLAGLVAAEQDALRFVPHPGVSLLRSAWPCDAIWHAVLGEDDAALAAIERPEAPVHLLVERMDDTVRMTRMDEPAWALTAALCAGMPLSLALERHASPDAPALLGAHLGAGRFVDFECRAAPVKEG